MWRNIHTGGIDGRIKFFSLDNGSACNLHELHPAGAPITSTNIYLHKVWATICTATHYLQAVGKIPSHRGPVSAKSGFRSPVALQPAMQQWVAQVVCGEPQRKREGWCLGSKPLPCLRSKWWLFIFSWDLPAPLLERQWKVSFIWSSIIWSNQVLTI